MVCFSCAEDNSLPKTEVEGEWLVYERSFVCSDKSLQEDVNRWFAISMEEGTDEFREYRLFFKKGGYEERVSRFIEEELAREKSFLGNYALGENNIVIDLTALSSIGNWSFSWRIIDRNVQDILAVEQVMDNKDISNMLAVYFERFRVIDKSVTGILKIKAIKIKE